jgi:hypothetical protein
LGPTKFSYMSKYDPKLGWYDREYMVSQVAGCVEMFILSRKHPSDYNLGFRFRLDEFYDVLRRRNFNRSVKPTMVSPRPDGKP